MKLSKKVIKQINEHTLSCYPEEMCGVLVKSDFIPLKNISTEPLKSFRFDKVEYSRIVNKAIAIVHSHPKHQRDVHTYDIRTPSVSDRKKQKVSGLPWLIVGTDGETVTPHVELNKSFNSTYEKRPFIWFINDCYTLVQDYYHFELNIDLPDSDLDFDPSDEGTGIFDKHIKDYGFKDIKSIDGIKNGDLVLLDHHEFKRNHLAIYHDEMILHQKKISGFDKFSDYIGRINRIIRYHGN